MRLRIMRKIQINLYSMVILRNCSRIGENTLQKNTLNNNLIQNNSISLKFSYNFKPYNTYLRKFTALCIYLTLF